MEKVGEKLSLTPRQIAERVGQLSKNPEALSRIYTQIVDRIANETTCFKGLFALGFEQALRVGEFVRTGHKQGVVWNANIETTGEFDPGTDSSKVSAPPPTKESVLIALATTSALPKQLEIAQHEEVHDTQWGNWWKQTMTLALWSVFPQDIKNNAEFFEIVAYRISDQEPHEATPEHLVDMLCKAKKDDGTLAYEGVNAEKVIASVRLIDQLLALWYPIRELMKLRPGQWDEKDHTYPALEKLVEVLCKRKSVEKEMLPMLIQKQKTYMIAEQQKAKEITQELIFK